MSPDLNINYRPSPNYEKLGVDLNTIEGKIAIYEDRVHNWLLAHARTLEKPPCHAGFVILMISMAYVEPYTMLKRGEDSIDHSKKFFVEGLIDIFPELNNIKIHYDVDKLNEVQKNIFDETMKAFYNEVRCGLFHDSITRQRVSLSGDYPFPIEIHCGSPTTEKEYSTVSEAQCEVFHILINPHKVLDRIEEHLDKHLAILRDRSNTTARVNFEKLWNLKFM